MDSSYSQSPPVDWLARVRLNRINLALAALGFLPMLAVFLFLSWNRPSYQFFPMALIAAGILGWRAAKAPRSPAPPGSLRSAQVLGLATGLLYLLACALWSPWLAYVSFLLGLVAALWSLGGKSMLKLFIPPLLMLLVILPPPLNGDEVLTVWLRRVAVGTSSVLLDWLQVTHAQDGNTLLLPGKTLLVEEACSGINSFILCNAFCLFWGLWQQRPPLWWLVAMFATSVFVVLGNIIRITAGAVAYYFWHFDLLSGRPHEIFGLVLLLGYCGLILSWDQWLVFLTHRDASPATRKTAEAVPQTAVAPPAGNPSAPAFGFKLSGAALALVGMAFFAAHFFLGGRHGVAQLPNINSVRELSFSMPASLNDWQRLDPGSGEAAWVQTYGVHSRSWNFQHNGITATVAVDYPLAGFHDVKSCYIGNGWEVLAENAAHNPQNGDDLHATRLDLRKSIQYALVFHSVMDRNGNWMHAPLNVRSRFSDTLGAPQTGYRVQLIATTYAPASPAAESDCQAFFIQARHLLTQQLLDQLQGAGAK